MKKYKLIKEYPGSPKLATELTPKVDKENTDTNNFYWEGSWFNPNYFSEYWEEVLQKDYEILRTCPIVGTIYSVKRLSDGEVFTVGDRAKTTTSKGSHTITQFRIQQYYTGRSSTGERNYDGIDKIWMDWEKDCGGDWLEFTEKVVEKDYEILSYANNSNCITTKRRGRENHDEYWNIHSVKRLSDGEVFTVGDLIKTPYTDCTRITKFQNPERNEYFIEIPTGFTRLVTIEKAKQPIFLTHDRKDIFEGDKVWYVNKEQHYYSGFIAVSGVTFRSDINAYFLTREGAEDYIEKNKVLFTTEDGVDIKEGDCFWFIGDDFRAVEAGSPAWSGSGRYSERKYFSTFETAEDYIEKNKVIFTTEDGVEIRYGNKVWWITGNNIIHNVNRWTGGNQCYESNKYFSTKEAAEDYIVLNSRALSLEDYENAFTSQHGTYNIKLYLAALVKQRLKIE